MQTPASSGTPRKQVESNRHSEDFGQVAGDDRDLAKRPQHEIDGWRKVSRHACAKSRPPGYRSSVRFTAHAHLLAVTHGYGRSEDAHVIHCDSQTRREHDKPDIAPQRSRERVLGVPM
jgi:hypothetical protein